MRRLGFALALFVALPVDPVSACHRFRVWHYPHPQQCRVSALTHYRAFVPFRKVAAREEGPAPKRTLVDQHPSEQAPFPLPSLTDGVFASVWGNEPDEFTRARLMLRATLGWE
jgi:hypothetical protein